MRFVIVLVALWPMLAPAQIVPQGATPDVVVKTLGTPRSRSATTTREIWLYPTYQVVFEKGRVVSLLPVPDEGGVVAWSNPPSDAGRSVVTSSTNAAKSAAGEKRGFPALGNITTPANRSTPGDVVAVGAPAIATAETGRVTLRSPDRRPSLHEKPDAIFRRPRWWWIALGLFGGIVAVFASALAWTWKRRMEEAQRVWSALDESVPVAEIAAPQPQPKPNAVDAPMQGSRPPSLADWELTPELLMQMEWKRFELIVERFYAASGFRTKRAGVGADNGSDIYLFRAGKERPLRCVQCKSCGEGIVGEERVRELFATVAAQKIPEGALVITGRFTSDALTFGRQNQLTLMEGEEFIARFNRLPLLVRRRIIGEVTNGDFVTPSCPRCGAKVVTPMRNRQERSSLPRCARYPKCPYTMTASQVPVLNGN
jgi:ssDNA-binding Zn-finger/Zn-ribbon topoisomerase 1